MIRATCLIALLMLSISSQAHGQTGDYMHALNMIHWINNATNSYKKIDNQFYYMDQSAARMIKKFNEQVLKIKAHHQLENKTLKSSLSEKQKDTLCSVYFVNASVSLFAWIEMHHTSSHGHDIQLIGKTDLDRDGQRDEEIILYDYRLIRKKHSLTSSKAAIDSGYSLHQLWTSLLQCKTSYNQTLELIQNHINDELFDSTIKSFLASWSKIVPNIDIRDKYFQEEIPLADEDLSLQIIAASSIDFIEKSLSLATYKD